MSTSEGYILNALQTPEPMRPVYEAIDRGYSTKEDILEETGLSEGLFDQAWSGLQLLRLVGREDHEYYTADLVWDTGHRSRDFRMTALHNLAQECTPPDWGKQAAPLLIYQYLLEEDIQYFENNDEGLYTEIDDWYRSEKGYDPQSSQGSITLNEPKFVNWSRQAAFLGLIYKTNGREHALRPDPQLIEESIRLAADGNRYVGMRAYIDWLQDNLIQVSLTADGRIPTALARTLYNLVRDDRIRLVERGDAGAIGLSNTPSSEGIDTEANTIELNA
jgi:hypothetical protein